MNEQQREAVNCEADKILCLAGAGSGKTFSMIERIGRLVSEGVAPTSILVMTFTNAAAFEMQERYRKKFTNTNIPEFRTFHSFCYSLISKDYAVRNAIGYKQIPQVADENQVKRIETSAKIQCGIKLSEAKLSGKDTLTPSEKYQVDLFKKAVDRLLRKEGLITFDILCYDVCKLFKSDHESIQKYKQQYTHIFVDEFQDTDPKQWDFVQSFKGSKVFVVGDALQAIYAFRGADSSIIKALSKDPNWHTVRLYQNYRSTKEICEYANLYSDYADDNYRIAIASDREGLPVTEICNWTEGTYKPFDISVVQRLADQVKYIPGTTAVLCRTNKEVQCILEYFKDSGVDCAVGKQDMDAIHLLKSVVDDKYMIDWLSTFLDATTYTGYLMLMQINASDESPLTTFLSAFRDHKAIKDKFSKICRLKTILECPDNLPFLKCSQCFNFLGIRGAVVDTAAVTVPDMVEYMCEVIANHQTSGLYVGTIHSSKGLEYDNVFLMNVGSKSFRLTGEDNLNLFYVGVTRAKNHLTVYKSKRC